MNYQQFILATKENVALSLGADTHLQIHTTLKNNGRERIGITIIEEHINISPTIYLEEYYKQYQDGFPLECIVESIIDLYHDVKFEHSWDMCMLKDFSSIQSKIAYKIIHAEKNEKLLKTIPYVAYLDFAIVFYILHEANESGTATIPITYPLLKLWNVSLDALQKTAFENTPTLLPATFKPMQLVIKELSGNNLQYENGEEELMYVLSNSLGVFGASCILYRDVLREIGEELGENYYLLPSSIHEMIIVPESKSPNREHLNEMVTEINETQVETEDVLSDCVYYFDCKTNQVS